jgi:hypothetical protein
MVEVRPASWEVHANVQDPGLDADLPFLPPLPLTRSHRAPGCSPAAPLPSNHKEAVRRRLSALKGRASNGVPSLCQHHVGYFFI